MSIGEMLYMSLMYQIFHSESLRHYNQNERYKIDSTVVSA